MPDTTNKPVIFLAFANDRDDTVGYLRNLPNEARRLRDVLGPAEQASLCEVVVRSNSTAGDIFKVFQDPKYRNRIAIFHYGGHANGYQLLLESSAGQSAAADAGGLAAFLAQQQGLQLVFLNGCSTQQHTEGLLDANISAVISTSRSIDDEVATDFSWQFYQGLAGGASVRTAYNEAEASVKTAKGGNTRALYFGDAGDSESQLDADRWPWNLYLREGSESADQWNLPEAVNDALFGLPPLPEQDLPESPYRHLNWFTRKDTEVFFGRGHQIRELYDRLTAPRTAPIMLFYGQSGVGKSSVLDAGLIPRLERDYDVRYLRRRAGGLLDTLRLAFLPEVADVPVESAWQVKEEQLGRPLIVFLDQVEELYTRPIADLPDELDQLLTLVKSIFVQFDQRPQGKLVLGFRKEWLAELEAQLVDYELPRTKVFLEPLDRRGIIEVVQGPARSERLREHYGLTVQDGLAEIIADDLLADRDSAIAPTLQILLTKMWTKATEKNYEHPQFSRQLYQHLKRDGILLRDFLNQQIAAFREQFPEAVDSGLLLDIMALHTTPLGTADQCTVEQLHHQYAHLRARLPDLIQQCQDLYLLTVSASTEKDSAKTTRLAHDTLAPLIRERFDQSDKPGQRARRILDNRSVDWEDDRVSTPLDEADLAVVEQGVRGTRALTETEQRLLDASRELRARLQRNRNILKALGVVAALVIALTAGIAGWQSWQLGIANDALGETVADLDTSNKGLWQETATMHWNSGVAVRDLEDDPLKAAHHFAMAFNSFQRGDQKAHAADTQFACGLLLREYGPVAAVLSHDSYVDGVQLSPDGKQLATWNWDTVKVWDVPVYTLSHSFTHHGGVRAVAFTNDANRLATCSQDGTAKLWSLGSNGLPTTFSHGELIMGAVFNQNDDRLLTRAGNSVKLWNVADGQLIQTFTHDIVEGVGSVETAVFNDDESRVLTASWDKTVRIWSIESGKPLATFPHPDRVDGAAYTKDNSGVLTWGWHDKTLRIWDVSEQDTPMSLRLPERVKGASFSQDNARILTWGFGVARVIDVESEGTTALFEHEGLINGAMFDSNEKQVLTWGNDGSAKLWDIASNRLITSVHHQEDVNAAALAHDGRQIISGSRDATVRVCDITESGRPPRVYALGQYGANRDGVRRIKFNRQRTKLLTWGSHGTVTLWDFEKETRDATFEMQDGFQVDGVEYNRSEDRLFIWSHNDEYKSTVQFWDVRTSAIDVDLSHVRWVSGVQLSDDEKRLLTWTTENTVRIWDIEKEVVVAEFPPEANFRNARLSNDGKRVAIKSGNNVRVWDVDKQERIATINGPQRDSGGEDGPSPELIAFRPSQWQVLVVESDNAVLMDIDTKSVIRQFPHQQLDYASFTDSGDLLVTHSSDVVRFWDVHSAEMLAEVPVTESSRGGAAFNRSNQLILFQHFETDDTAFVWDIRAEEFVATIRQGSRILHTAFGDKHEWIATGGWDDGAVKVWSIRMPQPIAVFSHKSGQSTWGAEFYLDDTKLLTWGDDGEAILWDLTVDPLLVLPDNVTADALALQVEVTTGTRLDATGKILALTQEQWEKRKQIFDQIDVQPSAD